MTGSPLNSALRQFEITDANLVKAEKLLTKIVSAIPQGIVFGSDYEYDDNRRFLEEIINSLPSIDGWKPNIIMMDLNDIAQARLDARECGEIEIEIAFERTIDEPEKLLREYRFKFNQKRRELTRETIISTLDKIDDNLKKLSHEIKVSQKPLTIVAEITITTIIDGLDIIETLLGSMESNSPPLMELKKRIASMSIEDIQLILNHDWPNTKQGILRSLYSKYEPIPIEVSDLGLLTDSEPKGAVITKLKWDTLCDEDFERLIFSLISAEKEYENPKWLTKTKASDRGRDLSVDRVYIDPLAGTIRQYVIIQCKNWQSRSVSTGDVTEVKDQMILWDNPNVDVLIIATSGRFSSDAVSLIEKHNKSDRALKIEMWPESHLESILAKRPAIIGEFMLR